MRCLVAAVHHERVQVRRRNGAIFSRVAGPFDNALLQQAHQDRFGDLAVGFAIEVVQGVGFVMFREIARLLRGQTIMSSERAEPIQTGFAKCMFP
jgi:hypothetical protein